MFDDNANMHEIANDDELLLSESRDRLADMPSFANRTAAQQRNRRRVSTTVIETAQCFARARL